ncbi:MAG: MFS transporter [Candidatus Peregrinibacteria bacterium]|nr:MFS transporter [Candidatus Peregrinibacteria bacterium]
MLDFFQKITSDTRSLPSSVKLIVLVIFLRTFGWGFIDPFYSMYVDLFGDSYKSVGYLVALMNFVGLLVVLPLLKLADKVRDTQIMRDGEVLYLFAIFFYVMAGLTQQVSLLLVALIINGVALSLFVVGAESFIRRHTRRGTETRSFAFLTAIQYLGWVLGMIIGAFTVQYYNFSTMFLFLLPGTIAGFLILRRVSESGIRSLVSGFRKYFHKPRDFEFILDDLRALNRKTFFFLFLAFFDGVIIMFSYLFIPLFALSIDLSLKEIALLMASMYLPFIFSYIISEATERFRQMNVIALGLFIGGLAFICLSFIIDQLWVVLLAALTSLSLAIIRPTYNGILTELTPRRMLGEITGLNKISMRIGFIVGPIVSGYLADAYSIQVAFFVIAIFAFSLAALAIVFKGVELLQAKN